MQQMTKKEKRMLTSLDVKAAVATKDTVAILGTAVSLEKSCIRQTTGSNCKEEKPCPGLI